MKRVIGMMLCVEMLLGATQAMGYGYSYSHNGRLLLESKFAWMHTEQVMIAPGNGGLRVDARVTIELTDMNVVDPRSAYAGDTNRIGFPPTPGYRQDWNAGYGNAVYPGGDDTTHWSGEVDNSPANTDYRLHIGTRLEGYFIGGYLGSGGTWWPSIYHTLKNGWFQNCRVYIYHNIEENRDPFVAPEGYTLMMEVEGGDHTHSVVSLYYYKETSVNGEPWETRIRVATVEPTSGTEFTMYPDVHGTYKYDYAPHSNDVPMRGYVARTFIPDAANGTDFVARNMTDMLNRAKAEIGSAAFAWDIKKGYAKLDTFFTNRIEPALMMNTLSADKFVRGFNYLVRTSDLAQVVNHYWKVQYKTVNEGNKDGLSIALDFLPDTFHITGYALFEHYTGVFDIPIAPVNGDSLGTRDTVFVQPKLLTVLQDIPVYIKADTVRYWETFYDSIPVYVHDTLHDTTVIARDTDTIQVAVHDTLYKDTLYAETLQVVVHDTVRQTVHDTITVALDTLYADTLYADSFIVKVHDTLYKDTLYAGTDTVVEQVRDTVYLTQVRRDTVPIPVIIYDTAYVHDTVSEREEVYIVIDPVTGVRTEVSAEARVVSYANAVRLEGLTPGESFSVYTTTGRKLIAGVAPQSGTYLLYDLPPATYILKHAGRYMKFVH